MRATDGDRLYLPDPIPNVLHGIPVLKGAPILMPADNDSHFHYLSGIFLGLAISFLSCVSAADAKGFRFRLLGTKVVIGGAAWALSSAKTGVSSIWHRLGFAMEIVIVPLLVLWRARMARLTPQVG